MKAAWWASLLLSVLWVRPVQGQWAVAESGPMTMVHTSIAFQQTLNTAEAVFQSAQWVLNLTSFDSQGSTLDTSRLDGILMQTYTVLWDIQAIEQQVRDLFGLEGAASSMRDLQQRLFTIRRIQMEQYTAARRAQTLPILVEKTLADLRVLWMRILGILGGKQGSQQVQALLVVLNETQARTEVAMAAFHQPQLTEGQTQLFVDESLECINRELFASMPRRRP